MHRDSQATRNALKRLPKSLTSVTDASLSKLVTGGTSSGLSKGPEAVGHAIIKPQDLLGRYFAKGLLHGHPQAFTPPKTRPANFRHIYGQTCSMGLRSGDFGGQIPKSNLRTLLSRSHFLVDFDVCMLAPSC